MPLVYFNNILSFSWFKNKRKKTKKGSQEVVSSQRKVISASGTVFPFVEETTQTQLNSDPQTSFASMAASSSTSSSSSSSSPDLASSSPHRGRRRRHLHRDRDALKIRKKSHRSRAKRSKRTHRSSDGYSSSSSEDCRSPSNWYEYQISFSLCFHIPYVSNCSGNASFTFLCPLA